MTEASAELATPQDVAREFGTTKTTVIRWFKNGTIPAVVAQGKVYRFDMDAVRTALRESASRQQKGGGER